MRRAVLGGVGPMPASHGRMIVSASFAALQPGLAAPARHYHRAHIQRAGYSAISSPFSRSSPPVAGRRWLSSQSDNGDEKRGALVAPNERDTARQEQTDVRRTANV